MNSITRTLVLTVVAFGLALPAVAQTATSPANPNNITATVLKACSVTTFTVVFGDYDATAPSAKTPTNTPSFDVRCTVGTTYNVTLGQGTNYTTTRRMQLGTTGSFLAYELTLSQPTGGGTGTGAAQTYGVNGSIPVSQFVTPGAYTDTVVVTVAY